MKVYIAGPVSSIKDDNRPAFDRAQAVVIQSGHEAIIPHQVLPRRPELQWADYMRATLREMLTCDEVRVLPGWQFSKGTRIEVEVAHWLDIPVRPVNDSASEAELRALDERAP